MPAAPAPTTQTSDGASTAPGSSRKSKSIVALNAPASGCLALPLRHCLLPPAAEHGDRIERATVIREVCVMLPEELLDGIGPQVAAQLRTTVVPRFAREMAEVAPEPFGEGDLKPALAFAQYPSRQPGFDCLAQYIFPGPAASLHPHRHGQAPVDKIVRQERHAGFERMGHASPVEPVEQRPRHMNREVGKHELFERIEAVGVFRVEMFLLEPLERARPVEACQKGRLVQAPSNIRRGDLGGCEESLEAASEQRRIAEAAGILNQVVPL